MGLDIISVFNPSKEKNIQTRADKIRQSDDTYMSVQFAGAIVSYLVQSELISGTEADHKDLISEIADDILEWLQQPVEEE